MQSESGGNQRLIPATLALQDGMLILSVNLTIKPENVETFLAQAMQNAAASRAEPGCRQFDVLVDPKDRTRLMLFEIYDDEAAFEAHQQTAHFKSYLADGVPLLAARERHFWQRISPP
jgi:(4S)-4-hydroxy-5-phosphonooxypentane-2,3-dione isomerase